MKEKLDELDVATLISLYNFLVSISNRRNAATLVEDVILEKTGFSR